MVNISFRKLQPATYGAISAVIFFLLYLLSVTNAYFHKNAEPELVLAFFGFPASWIVISIFHPLLDWLGPFGSTNRRIGEWALLGIAGTVQYWLFGFLVARFIAYYWTNCIDRSEDQ